VVHFHWQCSSSGYFSSNSFEFACAASVTHTPNQTIQLTAGRRHASRLMTSTLPLQFMLALASGG
jgi:hypothetical protein